MRSKYKVYETECPYFVTSTILEWIPIFTSKKYFQALMDSLNFCSDHKGLCIYAWVIMDNHFHLVCQAKELTKVMQSLKRHTAKTIIELLEEDNKKWALNLFAFYKKRFKITSRHQIWQEGFQPKFIKDDRMLEQKVEYIHYNPVERGLVLDPLHWPYSSARFYESGEGSFVHMAPLEDIW